MNSAHRQPPPVDDQLLSPDARIATRSSSRTGAFPSDHFAVESQIRQRGFDPADVADPRVAPRVRAKRLLHRGRRAWPPSTRHGDSLALVLLPGVQYFTGQVLPMAEITVAAATPSAGALVGFDLAHAAGNIAPAACTTGTSTSPPGAPTST